MYFRFNLINNYFIVCMPCLSFALPITSIFAKVPQKPLKDKILWNPLHGLTSSAVYIASASLNFVVYIASASFNFVVYIASASLNFVVYGYRLFTLRCLEFNLQLPLSIWLKSTFINFHKRPKHL